MFETQKPFMKDILLDHSVLKKQALFSSFVIPKLFSIFYAFIHSFIPKNLSFHLKSFPFSIKNFL